MAKNSRILGKELDKRTLFMVNKFVELLFKKEHTLDSLQKHVQTHGGTPWIHGNKGKKAPNAFKFDNIRNAVQYFQNYNSQNSIPQPVGPRSGGPDPPNFLP